MVQVTDIRKFKNEVTVLITSGQLHIAIDKVLCFENLGDDRKTALILKMNLSDLRHEVNRRLINRQEAIMEKNRIALSILDILDNLNEG